MTRRLAAALAVLGAASFVAAHAGWRVIRPDPATPRLALTTAAEVVASLEDIPGARIDVTATIEDGEQHLAILIANDGEDALVFEERAQPGQIRVYVEDADLLVLSVNGGTVEPRASMDTLLRLFPLVYLGPGQSFRATVVVPDRLVPNVPGYRPAEDDAPGMGGPVRHVIVAFDVLVIADASQLTLEPTGMLFARGIGPRWQRLGARVGLQRPVSARPRGGTHRVSILDRPALPPLTSRPPVPIAAAP